MWQPVAVSVYLFISVTSLTTFQVICQEDGSTKLSFNGTKIANGGYIDVDDIGSSEYDALICHTNKSSCCRTERAGEWYFPNGTILGNKGSNYGHISYFYRDRGQGVVRLKRISYPSERGNFKCEIPDSYGYRRTLHINIMDIGAVVISPTGPVLAIIGMNLTLRCLADIMPNPLPQNVSSPYFEWFWGTTPLPSDVTVSRVVKSGNSYISTVQFSPLQLNHTGNYTCRLGGNERLQAHTMVVANEMIIDIQPVDLIVNRNGLATFNVTVQGDPDDFTFQWQRNGSDLVERGGKFKGVNTSILKIQYVQANDEGNYWCVITNRAGLTVTTNEVLLIVVDFPEKPNITQLSSTSTSINLSWTQNMTSDVDWFEIDYNFTIRQCPDLIHSASLKINSSMRHYTLLDSTMTPIEEDSEYTITLRAVNIAGKTEADLQTISTPAAAPTAGPENLTNTSTTDTSITIKWGSIDCRHRNGEIVGYTVTHNSSSENQKSVMVSVQTFTATGLPPNVMYTFGVQAISRSNGSGPTTTIEVETSSPQGIIIVYQQQSYKNLSIVNFNMDTSILQCYTNKSGCCRFQHGGKGEWIFPNGSKVRTNGNGDDLYRTRGQAVVNLHWRENAMIPIGIFCCEIPDEPLQKACIGVYPENEGTPVVDGMMYDPNTTDLVCISSGGPATDVSWKSNGKLLDLSMSETTYRQTQRIISTEHSTFEMSLHILNKSIENFNTTYECTVMNSKGNDSSAISLEALEIMSGNLSLGLNSSLTCKSIIPVDVMEWMDSDGETLVNKVNTDNLSLTFEPVNISIHNSQFTCQANKNGSVIKTIVAKISVENYLMIQLQISKSAQTIGETFVINCSAILPPDGTIPPTLTLTHPNGSNTATENGTSMSLVINPVKATDAGEYICNGMVVFPDMYNLPGVAAMDRQTVILKLPMILVGIIIGRAVPILRENYALTCVVSGIENLQPNIAYNWMKIDGDGVTSQVGNNSNTLFFAKLTTSDEGNYTCSVLISSGLLKEDIRKVSGPISINFQAPSSLIIDSEGINSTAVQISWRKGQELDVVDNITILYVYQGPCNCSDYPNPCQRETVIVADSNVTIVNLQEHSDYMFTVTANNPVGSSPAVIWNLKTPSDAPGGPPKFLNTSSANLTSITIHWSGVDCIDQNSEISGYDIIVTSVNKENISSTMMAAANKSIHTVNGLFPSTEYSVRIAAEGDNKTGPYNNKTISTSSPTEIGLLLSGESVKNNSVVRWMDIGQGGDSLLCITNYTNCCENGVSGRWMLPNETDVPTSDTEDSSITQHHGTQFVQLAHHNGPPQPPTGVFMCNISDAANTENLIYVGIYDTNKDMIDLSVDFELIDPLNVTFQLKCTSVGRPIHQMMWRLNENTKFTSIFPILSDAISGTYHGIQVVEGRETGRYSCEATDENGLSISQKNLTVNGTIPLNEVYGVRINGPASYICWKTSSTQQLYRLFTGSYNINYTTEVDANNTVVEHVRDQDLFIQVESIQDNYLPSERQAIIIEEPAVRLMFNNQNLSNNSIVQISNVGTDELAIRCVTERIPCCKARKSGEWYYPNGTVVPKRVDYNWIFYRNRNDNGSVNLNRMSDSYATGTYCCQVPDKNCDGLNHTLCVELVSLPPIVASGVNIAGEHYSLNCSAMANVDNTTFEWFGPDDDIKLTNTSEITVVTRLTESILIFDTLKQSDEGVYKCRVTLDGEETNRTENVTVRAPNIAVNISMDQNASLGQSHFLNCSQSGAENIEPFITYQWSKVNNDSKTVVGNMSILYFSHLNLSDAAKYTCIVTVSSSYLNEGNVIVDQSNISLKLPIPTPTVHITAPNQTIFAGSSPSFTCTVQFDDTVDIPLIVNITFGPMNEDAIRSNDLVQRESVSLYSRTFTIDSIQATESGKQYVCIGRVLGKPPHIMAQSMDANSSTSLVFSSLTITITSSGRAIAGENYALTCAVKINGSYDVPVISWNSTLSNNSTSSYYNGTFFKVLSFHPLRFSHRNSYTCEVRISDIISTEVFHLRVRAQSALVEISDNENVPIPGKSFSLLCNVSGIATILNPILSYEWIRDNGTRAQVGTNSSTLYFNFLKLSDIGLYTCKVNINYNHLFNVYVRSETDFEIQLSVPKPTVKLVCNMPNPVLAGRSLTLTCAVELDPVVDIPLYITTVWIGPDGSRLRSAAPAAMESVTHYTSTLVVRQVELANTGIYTCSIGIGGDIQAMVEKHVTVGEGMFQLRFARTDDCQLWNSARVRSYRQYIEYALLEVIERQCKCSFPKNNLLEELFSCDKSTYVTTYRNTLIGTHNFNATQLIGFIQDWVSSGPKIKIDWFTVRVDSSCPVAIQSLDDQECGE